MKKFLDIQKRLERDISYENQLQCSLNSLPEDKILAWSKMKAYEVD